MSGSSVIKEKRRQDPKNGISIEYNQLNKLLTTDERDAVKH